VPLVTARIPETIAPSRLGRSFRWLLASSFISNIGDGIALTAGPLLVASLTHDPFIVSMALLAIGGLRARRFGITAPFWFGFIRSAILLAVLWRQFDNIVHASEIQPAA
jgi:hypothetical protein